MPPRHCWVVSTADKHSARRSVSAVCCRVRWGLVPSGCCALVPGAGRLIVWYDGYWWKFTVIRSLKLEFHAVIRKFFLQSSLGKISWLIFFFWGSFNANTCVFEYFSVCTMALLAHSVIIFIISHLIYYDPNFAHSYFSSTHIANCGITFGTSKKQYVVCTASFLPSIILPNVCIWSTQPYFGLNPACPFLDFVLLQQSSHYIFHYLAQYCAYGP